MASLLDDPSLELGGALDKVSPQTPVSGRVIRPPRSILNVVTGAGEAIGQDVGGMLQGLANYIKTPGMVASGEIPMGDVARAAQGFAANTALLGAGMPAPAGALRSLAGVNKAAAVDSEALLTAKVMASGGATPDQIWAKTGHYQDAFGNWRFEIPDQGAKLIAPPGTGVTTAGWAFEHPGLFRQYPDLAGLPVNFSTTLEHAGQMNKNVITGRPARMYINANQSPEQILKTFLHESGHGIQLLEDLPGGSSPEAFLPSGHATRVWNYLGRLERFNDHLKTAGIDPAAEDLGTQELNELREDLNREGTAINEVADRASADYRQVAGEMESFNVERRHDMPPEDLRRWSPPRTQDTPFGQETISPNEVQPLRHPMIRPAPVQWTWPNILSALAGLNQGQQ
jgi:hypothetical protein